MQTTNLKELSVVELKALAYDQIALVESIKNNITLINQELQERHNAPVEEKKEEPKSKTV